MKYTFLTLFIFPILAHAQFHTDSSYATNAAMKRLYKKSECQKFIKEYESLAPLNPYQGSTQYKIIMLNDKAAKEGCRMTEKEYLKQSNNPSDKIAYNFLKSQERTDAMAERYIKRLYSRPECTNFIPQFKELANLPNGVSSTNVKYINLWQKVEQQKCGKSQQEILDESSNPINKIFGSYNKNLQRSDNMAKRYIDKLKPNPECQMFKNKFNSLAELSQLDGKTIVQYQNTWKNVIELKCEK